MKTSIEPSGAGVGLQWGGLLFRAASRFNMQCVGGGAGQLVAKAHSVGGGWLGAEERP